MELYIKLGAQIIFLLACMVFVAYSIIGMYALNTYGRSKTVTMTVSILYSGVVVVLMGWGWVVLGRLQ